MEELSREIDVSRPTLSRYFQDPGSVRTRTRQKIEDRLATVDYVPNFFAMNLNRKRTGLIGVIIPHLNDIFQTGLIDEIEAAAETLDFRVMVQNSHNDSRRETAAIEALRSMNAEGILISPLGRSSNIEAFRRASLQLPMVLIDSAIPDAAGSFDFVGNDNFQSIGLIVDYLVRSGRDPVFFPLPAVNMNAQERIDAFRAAMAAHGRKPEVLDVSDFTQDWQFEKIGYEAMKNFFAAGRYTRATVLCASDRIALGAVKAAHEFGLFGTGTAGGFCIAGHDNDVLTRFLHPSITTVEQNITDIAREAVAILTRRIALGRQAPPDQPEIRRIPARLIIHGSG